MICCPLSTVRKIGRKAGCFEALLARKAEQEKREKQRQKKQRDKERDFKSSVGKFKGGMLTLGSRAMKAYG